MAKPEIVICLGSSCFARGNERNVQVIEEYLARHGLQDEVDLVLNGALCRGRCAEGPIVVINGEVHGQVDEGTMLELLKRALPGKE